MSKAMDDLHATLARRDKVHRRIMKALDHYDKEQAMNTVMMWMSIEDLENAAKTICKDGQ